MHSSLWKITLFFTIFGTRPTFQTDLDRKKLKNDAHEMFMHGYNSYMNYAFPADELMPLSCKGRIRGVTPSRGDVDDVLGNFSVTLLDSLDTLVVMNELDEFEKAVELVKEHVRYDSDLVVSVFETNIRVLGGLISGHVLAELVKEKYPNRLKSYNKHLLKMATEVGNRLLPAFNTTSGLPYSRINMKYGMLDNLKRQKDTCTACGGTMILEFAALTRLTGDPIYETKARKAMDFLWQQRHRASDLMGTVLNVHSGDWVRRDSGIGAGIDSYYEYTLKAYILLGDESYLDRFNKHYEAIMRYVNKGPLFVDVHMHRPTVATRGFMDSLLAFWPGLQVLKGDVKQAVEVHEMLFQVIQKHKFLPEAFTHDFQVHWAEHPIRPEFVESTYFLYRATKDPHYLRVAKQIMESINEYVRVPCGFAALKDIRTMKKEDQMESFVLSETFKYLYMIFTEADDLIFDPDHYVLTTEAHFLPLSMGHDERKTDFPRKVMLRSDEPQKQNYVCANPIDFTKLPMEREEAQLIRERVKDLVVDLTSGGVSSGYARKVVVTGGCEAPVDRIRAWTFSSSNQEHIKQLRQMGIELSRQDEGRMNLIHHAGNAISPAWETAGIEFMQEMKEYVERLDIERFYIDRTDRFVQIHSWPFLGKPSFVGSPAQFGLELQRYGNVVGHVAKAIPFRACSAILNAKELEGKIALVERSDCVFQDKARHVQLAGAIGMIVIDHDLNSMYTLDKAPFQMASDKDTKDDIDISSVFLYRKEGEFLMSALKQNPDLVISLSYNGADATSVLDLLKTGKDRKVIPRKCALEDGDLVFHNANYPELIFNFRFNGVNQASDPRLHQEIVERHVTEMQNYISFGDVAHSTKFYEIVRTAAYGALDLHVEDEDVYQLFVAMTTMTMKPIPQTVWNRLPGPITKVRCRGRDQMLTCSRVAI